jgi:hypothetical protein
MKDYKISIKVDILMYNRLKRESVEKDIPVSQIIRDAITSYFRQEDNK